MHPVLENLLVLPIFSLQLAISWQDISQEKKAKKSKVSARPTKVHTQGMRVLMFPLEIKVFFRHE